MSFVPGSIRIFYDESTDSVSGTVRWKPTKSLWIGAMTATALIAGPLTFSLDALALLLVLCGVTLSLGHSVGMHRKMIHGAFDCPLWLEYALIELVGMAGPFGMIRQHDVRDWSQRQPACHDFLCHRRPLWRDYIEQLHCELRQPRGPVLQLEPRLANDPVFNWMERTWRWHQLPLAFALYALGGWSWVVWGIAVRVTICVTGHWLVSYFAHREGAQSWIVRGAGVQGFNLPLAAFLSMGESWHNNHHAYPASARIGLYADQPDPGWWVIVALQRLGLVWNVNTPETIPPRAALERLPAAHVGWKLLHAVGYIRSMIKTERLILREWRDEDLPLIAAINGDPVAMRHFVAPLTRAESDAAIERYRIHQERYGCCMWAVEAPGVAPVIGVLGLARTGFEPPLATGTEIGWRLAPAHWGKGYASEGARAALAFGFERCGLDEIVSMTTLVNEPSWRVIERIGMTRDFAGDFDHPRVPDGHKLKRHILYRLNREDWERRQ